MNEMTKIEDGMAVVDVTGNKVGKVRSYKMGDPNAVTSDGQEMESGDEEGLWGMVRRAFGDDSDLHPQQRERLLRVGYVEIDATGFKKDFVVPADHVDRVDGDTVHLSVEAP